MASSKGFLGLKGCHLHLVSLSFASFSLELLALWPPNGSLGLLRATPTSNRRCWIGWQIASGSS